jgi:FkbM family methyltransferase
LKLVTQGRRLRISRTLPLAQNNMKTMKQLICRGIAAIAHGPTKTPALPEWTNHDQEMLEFYKEFVPNGGLCFDIGANIGNRTRVFLKLGAHVVAVEPQNECVRSIRGWYGRNPHLTIVPKAIGERAGTAEMFISNASTASSLSPAWIQTVKNSGRFHPSCSWNKKRMVPTTTLDALIKCHGIPDFIKIDVEGYELAVVKGLSTPVKVLSMEFIPEDVRATFDCLSHLQALGDIHVNFSLGESMKLALAEWLSPEEIQPRLDAYHGDKELFGDVYVRFKTI